MLPVASLMTVVIHTNTQAFFLGGGVMQNIYGLRLYHVFFMNAKKNLLMAFRDTAFRHVASVVRGLC